MNDMDDAPNWVEMRSKCSTKGMYGQLMARMREDMHERNEIRDENPADPGDESDRFALREDAAVRDGFSIHDRRANYRRAVDVSLKDGIIWISPDGIPTAPHPMQLTISFTDRPECVFALRTDHEPLHLETWQVSKRALEALFFHYAPKKL